MKDYPSADPKMGPTEKKKQGNLDFEHHMLHDSDKMAPGDRVKLIVHGHVHDNRGEDEFSPGNIHIKVHSVEHHPEQDSQEDKSKKPNASEMRMDDLKKKITNLMEKDEDMEGHSEKGIKEEGEDEEGKK
jgi:hypothetical protein